MKEWKNGRMEELKNGRMTLLESQLTNQPINQLTLSTQNILESQTFQKTKYYEKDINHKFEQHRFSYRR